MIRSHATICRTLRRIPRTPGSYAVTVGKPVSLRRAFSLAEIMIAIGVLGIGMLMVAATFPVGLDQARVVAEKSTAPIVAEEAFATLRLYLDDPNAAPRVWDSTGNYLVTFREAVVNTISLPGVLNVLMIDPPTRATRSLNDWLGSPDLRLRTDPSGINYPRYVLYGTPPSPPADTADLTPAGSPLGAATRFYPSTRAVLAANDADFPYTWSVLLGRGRTSNEVGFVVFVTRRSLATPVLIRAEFPKPPPVANSSIINTFPVEQMDPVSGSVITGVAPDAFIEGGFLVRAADAQLFRVLSIQPGVPQITLDGFADANSNGEEQFWFIPVDPATGRSPVVGVYVRSLPL